MYPVHITSRNNFLFTSTICFCWFPNLKGWSIQKKESEAQRKAVSNLWLSLHQEKKEFLERGWAHQGQRTTLLWGTHHLEHYGMLVAKRSPQKYIYPYKYQIPLLSFSLKEQVVGKKTCNSSSTVARQNMPHLTRPIRCQDASSIWLCYVDFKDIETPKSMFIA